MDIKLTDDQVREAVAGAIASLMSGENRAELIATAIKNLLTGEEQRGSYPRRVLMQAIFEDTLQAWAREEVRRLVREDATIAQKVEAVVREGIDCGLGGDNRAKLVDMIAAAVGGAFSPKRY